MDWGIVSFEGAAMRLNGLPADQGRWSPSVDLSARQDHLGAIGHAAYALHGRLVKDGSHARTDSAEAASALSAHQFRTGSALTAVPASHAKDDAEVQTSLSVSRISDSAG
ncbi:hypothetical protein [Streptomyces sp. NPDC058486]|uniref:hypothetical protein n=1 Tax=unclassified Streptomyces TaxID=2593676 RepID=UPI00366196AF